jgi:transposase
MEIRSVGIDLGKTTFHLVALGDNGKVLLKKKFSQKQLIIFTANMHRSGRRMYAMARRQISPRSPRFDAPPLPPSMPCRCLLFY